MMYSRDLHSNFEQKQNRREAFNSQANSVNLKQSISTRQYTQVKSQQNLHVLKLQSKALDLLKRIEHQKFQICTLTDQADTLMKLCDEQKSYLRSINVDMMKQQYQQQISLLCQQRQKILRLIQNLKEQKQLYRAQKQEKINTARYQNQILTQKIQKALLEKQQLLMLINEKSCLKKEFQCKVNEQQQKLDQYRHIERKVAISLKQLQELKRKQFQL